MADQQAENLLGDDVFDEWDNQRVMPFYKALPELVPSFWLCLETYGAERDFYSFIRFGKTHFGILCDRLFGRGNHVHMISQIVSDRTALAIFLHKVSREEETFSQISLFFRIAPSTAQRIFTKVLDFMFHSQYVRGAVRFADAASRAVLAEKMCRKVGHFAFASVDATVFRIPRPSSGPFPTSYYDGHHGFYALKYQAIVSPEGRVISLSDGAPGSWHDAKLFRRWHLMAGEHSVLNRLQQNEKILADAAYPAVDFPCLLKTNPTDPSISRGRLSVEWFFGHLKNLWRVCHGNSLVSMAHRKQLYPVLFALTNVHQSYYGNEISIYFNQ